MLAEASVSPGWLLSLAGESRNKRFGGWLKRFGCVNQEPEQNSDLAEVSLLATDPKQRDADTRMLIPASFMLGES
jgi:hypothetical protein